MKTPYYETPEIKHAVALAAVMADKIERVKRLREILAGIGLHEAVQMIVAYEVGEQKYFDYRDKRNEEANAAEKAKAAEKNMSLEVDAWWNGLDFEEKKEVF